MTSDFQLLRTASFSRLDLLHKIGQLFLNLLKPRLHGCDILPLDLNANGVSGEVCPVGNDLFRIAGVLELIIGSVLLLAEIPHAEVPALPIFLALKKIIFLAFGFFFERTLEPKALAQLRILTFDNGFVSILVALVSAISLVTVLASLGAPLSFAHCLFSFG